VIGPISISVLAVVIAISFGAGFVARRRQESRARLLEVLARAVESDRPLPPLLARIASETTGGAQRSIDRLAQRLGTGYSLAEAFQEAGGGLLAPRDIEAIRYAEDGPTLSAVLHELARDAGRALTFRHRIGLALVYPALLTPIFLFTWWRMADLSAAFSVPNLPYFDLSFVKPYLPFLGIAILGTFVLLFSPSFSSLRPGRITWVSKGAALARLYRLAAVHHDAGRPLPDALRRAAEGSGRRSVRNQAEAAAARVAAGESLPEVWPWFPAAGAGLASRLRRVADLRAERQRERLRRRLALVHPLTLLIFAAATFVEFRYLVGLFGQALRETMPW
jgi:type II secretory pathway component PulF